LDEERLDVDRLPKHRASRFQRSKVRQGSNAGRRTERLFGKTDGREPITESRELLGSSDHERFGGPSCCFELCRHSGSGNQGRPRNRSGVAGSAMD
jgi:hypothetical protein